MAVRPIFVVSLDNKFFIKQDTEFEFYSGFSDKQKRKCIQSLHKEYLKKIMARKSWRFQASQKKKLAGS